MVFGRELHLPYDMVDLVDRQYDIHHYARHYLKEASDKMKACYNHLPNSALFQEGSEVWLHCLTWTRGNSPKVQAS
jgi:hypothetical protein